MNENPMEVLKELWDKMHDKYQSIPDNDVEGQPDLTYYDGMRAGLAWAEYQVTNKMNAIQMPGTEK